MGGNDSYFWHKLRINLQEVFKLEKLSDIYVKSFTLKGTTSNDKSLFFVLDIEEFNIYRPSNNKYLKNKILFRNTIEPTVSAATKVVSYTFPNKSYYVGTTNPGNFYNLNLTLTNENDKSVDDSDNLIFYNREAATNRFIIELEFIPREKPNDIIFDRTPYGNALNAQA